MKQDETIFKARKKYVAVMVICFLYAGFSLLSLFFAAYDFFWRPEVRTLQFEMGPSDLNDLNHAFERPGGDRNFFFLRSSRSPFLLFTSPVVLSNFLGGVVAMLAGIALWGLIREKEMKAVRQHTAGKLLLPDEKAIVEALKNSGHELTQSRLARETGLSKVQVHRALKRLEAKDAIDKFEFGLTNKIVLKKDFLD